jgi:hypothetical protein
VVNDSDHPDEVLKVDGDMGAAAGSAKLFFPPPQHRLDDIVLEFDFGLRTTVAEKERDEARVGGVGDHEAFRRAYTMGRIAEDYLERYGEPFFAETDGDFPINSKNEKWKDGYINHDPWTSSIKWKWREGGQQVEFYGLLIVRSGRIEVEYSPDVHKF